MAGVNEINLNPESKSALRAGQESMENDFASKLVGSMDLPATLSDAIEKEHRTDKGEDREEEEEEVEAEEEEKDEESDSEDETEENDDEEDEDLVPKSKFQKRVDELTRQKKELERRLSKLEESSEKSKTRDSDSEKLEQMSEDELKQLKRQVRIAQVKNSSDEAKLAELVDLEEKVDGALRNGPQKFQSEQLSRFHEAVNETASQFENFDKVGKKIFESAKEIFDDTPELQKSPTGQARAWKMAVKQYSQMETLTAGKSKAEKLEREVNNLKKKVTMDSGSQKGKVEDNSMDKSFKKAKYGDHEDKVDFFKKRLNIDGMIPEKFRDK